METAMENSKKEHLENKVSRKCHDSQGNRVTAKEKKSTAIQGRNVVTE
jgi:hypothetical protein